MNASQTKQVDDVLQAVSEERRRRVLRHLAENGDAPVPVGELVAVVSGGESGHPRDTTEVTLHHTTLPKLDDLGLVEYDPGSGTVRADFDGDVEALLSFVAERFE